MLELVNIPLNLFSCDRLNLTVVGNSLFYEDCKYMYITFNFIAFLVRDM